MIRRSILAKVALTAAAAAAVAAGTISSASAVSSSAEPVGAVAAPAPTRLDLGMVTPQARVIQKVVDVPAGFYEVSWQMSYPEVEGKVRTNVDGQQLADLVTPAKPGTFGVSAETECVYLTAGQHTIIIEGTSLPSIGAIASLVQVG